MTTTVRSSSGYTQEGYKDYVTKMHDWYEKGILSSDFVSHTTDYMNDDLIEDIISKTTGVFSRGDGLIDMLRNVSGSNLVALADPVLEGGQTIHLGNQPGTSFYRARRGHYHCL